MKHMISTAIAFATEKHNGQFDRGGLPYILHPLKVMHYLKTDDEELMCIAALHDVPEDCYDDPEDCYDELWKLKISFRVIEALRLLYHAKSQPYDEYIRKIASNLDAVRVKKADLRHNMDIRRLKGVTEKDMERLAKYAKAYHFLDQIELECACK